MTIALYSLFIYNKLTIKERIRNLLAQILKKITNLLKAYTKHKKKLFEKVIELRTKFLSANNYQDKINASNMLAQTLKSILL